MNIYPFLMNSIAKASKNRYSRANE